MDSLKNGSKSLPQDHRICRLSVNDRIWRHPAYWLTIFCIACAAVWRKGKAVPEGESAKR